MFYTIVKLDFYSPYFIQCSAAPCVDYYGIMSIGGAVPLCIAVLKSA